MRAKIPTILLILFLSLNVLAWGGVYPKLETYALWVIAGIFLSSVACHLNREKLWASSFRWILPLTLLIAFQLLPLPHWLLRILAPYTASETFDYLKSIGISPRALYPISIDPPATFTALIEWLSFCLTYLTLILAFQDTSSRKWFLRTVILLATLLACWGTLETLLYKPLFIFPRKGSLMFGSFINKNHAALFMALGAATSLTLLDYARALRKNYVGWAICFALISLGILFSGSRTGLLLLILEMAYFAYVRKNKFYVYTLGGFILAGIVWQAPILARFYQSTDLGTAPEQRLTFWLFALKSWVGNFLFGLGMGSFSLHSLQISQPSTWVHPEHVENDLLELLACLGIVGLGLCIYFFSSTLRRLKIAFTHKYTSPDTQSFAMMLMVIFLGSMFVFMSPLPVFQILFAAAIAGLSTSKQNGTQTAFSAFSQKACAVFLALIACGIFKSQVKKKLPLEEPAIISGQRLSTIERQAEILIWQEYIDRIKAQLKARPLDPEARYDLAKALARSGNPALAQDAYLKAEAINKLSPQQQIEALFYIGHYGSDTSFAISRVESILKNEHFLLEPAFRQDLELEIAFLKRKHLPIFEVLAGIHEVAHWKTALLLAFKAPLPSEQILKSWNYFTALQLPPEIWDAFFTRAWSFFQEGNTDINIYLEKLYFVRTDLCNLLQKVNSIPDRNRYFFSFPVDQFTVEPSSQARFERSGNSFRLKAKETRAELDFVEIPVANKASVKECTFKLELEYSGNPQNHILLISDRRPFPADTAEIKKKLNRWVITFDLSQQKIPHFEKIGFTPLENRSWFEIKKLDLLVNPRP